MLKLITGLSVVTVCMAAVVGAQGGAAPKDPMRVKSDAIHAKVLTLDTHVDMRNGDYGVLTAGQKVDLVKMQQGGMKGVFLAVFVGQRQAFDAAAYKAAFDSAMRQFDALDTLTQKTRPEMCAFAASPDEVERVAETGKRVVMTGVENGYPVGEDLANVKAFYDRGARYISLTHSGHNQIGDSSSDRNPPRSGGLSAFGKQVVAEMNRLGMMVDVSHSAPTTFWDVVKTSKAPIIASHSGCKAVNDVDRNLDDEQLQAVAKGGGVVQIVALGSYLKADSPERAEAVRKLREEIGMQPGGRGRMGGPPAQSQTPEGAGRSAEAPRGVHGAHAGDRREVPARHAEGLRRSSRPRREGGGHRSCRHRHRLRRRRRHPRVQRRVGSAQRDGGARSPRLLRKGHREDLGRQPPACLAGRGEDRRAGAEDRQVGDRREIRIRRIESGESDPGLTWSTPWTIDCWAGPACACRRCASAR